MDSYCGGLFLCLRMSILTHVLTDLRRLLLFQVAVRSILLRGFDQQIAQKIGEVMKHLGVKFIGPAVPSKIEKVRSKSFWHLPWKLLVMRA